MLDAEYDDAPLLAAVRAGRIAAVREELARAPRVSQRVFDAAISLRSATVLNLITQAREAASASAAAATPKQQITQSTSETTKSAPCDNERASVSTSTPSSSSSSSSSSKAQSRVSRALARVVRARGYNTPPPSSLATSRALVRDDFNELLARALAAPPTARDGTRAPLHGVVEWSAGATYTLARTTTPLDEFVAPRSRGLALVLVADDTDDAAAVVDVQRALAAVARVAVPTSPTTDVGAVARDAFAGERVALVGMGVDGVRRALVGATTPDGAAVDALLLVVDADAPLPAPRTFDAPDGVDYAALDGTPVVIVVQRRRQRRLDTTYEWLLAAAAAPLVWRTYVDDDDDDDDEVRALIDALAALFGYGARATARGAARALDGTAASGLAQFYVGTERRAPNSRSIKRVADALFGVTYDDAADVLGD